MADAVDSKSTALKRRGGSTPPPGTMYEPSGSLEVLGRPLALAVPDDGGGAFQLRSAPFVACWALVFDPN